MGWGAKGDPLRHRWQANWGHVAAGNRLFVGFLLEKPVRRRSVCMYVERVGGVGWGLPEARIWPTVGTYGDGGRANVNHHLSLPDSGWLRLLVDIFWGLDSHQSTTGWGPPFLPAQIGSMFWTLLGRR